MQKKIILFIVLYFFCYSLSCGKIKNFPNFNNSSDKLSVTVFGGAERVSGSLTLLEAGNKRYLIDCGLYYPEGEGEYEERQNKADALNSALPVDAASIDAIFITHSHLDHIGRIPLMFENGFKGKIYCTNATKIILREMLLEQIRYDNKVRDWKFSINSIKEGYDGNSYVTAHWNNCEWQNKISPRNLRGKISKRSEFQEELGIEISPCRSCAEIIVNFIMPNVSDYKYYTALNPDNNVKAVFLDAGHIPGSASVLLEVNQGKGISKKLLFSGDVGNYLGLFQNGPEPVPQADAIWMESTYGAYKRDQDINREFSEFKSDVAGVINGGGTAWIPAFALDRTQKILYLIKKAKEENIIQENISIICPSPTALAISEIYESEFRNKDGWFKKELYDETKLLPEFITKLPEVIPKTCILITTSGMMDAAFSDKLLKQLLPDKSTSVFLVGYQDPCTPGGQLKLDKNEIHWGENTIEVNAEVKNYGAFSAHADARDLNRWLSNQNKDKVKIFLMHGELSKMNEQIENLSGEGFKNVFIPAEGKTFDF